MFKAGDIVVDIQSDIFRGQPFRLIDREKDCDSDRFVLGSEKTKIKQTGKIWIKYQHIYTIDGHGYAYRRNCPVLRHATPVEKEQYIMDNTDSGALYQHKHTKEIGTIEYTTKGKQTYVVFNTRDDKTRLFKIEDIEPYQNEVTKTVEVVMYRNRLNGNLRVITLDVDSIDEQNPSGNWEQIASQEVTLSNNPNND